MTQISDKEYLTLYVCVLIGTLNFIFGLYDDHIKNFPDPDFKMQLSLLDGIQKVIDSDLDEMGIYGIDIKPEWSRVTSIIEEYRNKETQPFLLEKDYKKFVKCCQSYVSSISKKIIEKD